MNEIPVRREQADPESVIRSTDRDDCCAETWKLVTGGTGSIRHDELRKQNFNDTWRRAGQRE